MKYAVIVARILLGLPFLVFGANAIHPFFPMPPLSGDSGAFLGIMMRHGRVPFLGVLYLIASILLLIGRYVPVALVILGPILVVILLYHVTLDPSELVMPGVLALLEVFLIYAKWPTFRGIFTA
jgi:uncharacterized membrane protein YphA (DoxX/SURF4 family)